MRAALSRYRIGWMGHLHVMVCSSDDVQAGQIRYSGNRFEIAPKAMRRLIDQRSASCFLEIKQLANCILHVVNQQIVKVRQWVGRHPPAVALLERHMSKNSLGYLGRFSEAHTEVTKHMLVHQSDAELTGFDRSINCLYLAFALT